MSHYDFWSLVPPIAAIALAIYSKQVFPSLLLGIFLGYLVIKKSLLLAIFATIDGMVQVFADAGNTRTIMFCALVGSLILLIQLSGGVEGFIRYLTKRIEKSSGGDMSKKKKSVQFFALFTGMLIFVESSISVLTVGAVFRPVFDKLKISREKLAYIADSSSAPSCILIPFNGWGAYLMGLLAIEGYSAPFSTLMSTIPFNFYPFAALSILIWSIATDRNFGPMKTAEHRVNTTGALLSPTAQPTVSDEISSVQPHEKAVFAPMNMIVPIFVMVVMMPIILIYTGFKEIPTADLTPSFFDNLLNALGKGSGSFSVLFSVLSSILVASVMYFQQKILTTQEIIENILKGIGGLMPLALLMLLAFALNTVCRELGTGNYVAAVAEQWLSPSLVPVILFVVSSFIAFSTGTSWGTFAIMIAIAIPMAQQLNANETLALAAAIGGGIFGDHCSPISDTTIISSMAANTDHIDHVKTQLPYALMAGGISIVLYLVAGFIL